MDETQAAKIQRMLPFLNERQKRLYLANEATSIGYGGVTQISQLTGVSRITISNGIKEIALDKEELDKTRCRKIGGGRKSTREKYPEIKKEIERLIESQINGNPENSLKYTSKSIRNIERELKKIGYDISYVTISDLLKEYGYSLQSNRKELATTKKQPDRNDQFEYINKKALAYSKRGCPVLSIDAKKKENIGNYKNNGKEYYKKGESTLVYDHDFQKELGKATPYGIYDIFRNAGFVNVTLSSDTASFAVASIKRWWKLVGIKYYSTAKEILITADCGVSNGYRVHLWKYELQKLANQINKKITVLHFPPGTSKWNKIEHRLFSFISKNWRGKPLISTAVIISLINATKTEKGLTVY